YPRSVGAGSPSGLWFSPARSRRGGRRLSRGLVAGSARALHSRRHVKETGAMTGIHFVTDEKGRKVAVQIDLKRYGALWEAFRDGLVAESRRKEQGIPYEQ